MKHRNWKIIVAASLMLASVMAHSGEIDLDKPLSAGKGSVVFSYTVHGAGADAAVLTAGTAVRSTVQWRAIDKPGLDGSVSVDLGQFILGAPDTFSKTARKQKGRFVRLELPEGEYEFHRFNSMVFGGRPGAMNSGSRAFSRRFIVSAGKTNYIGNLDILAMWPVYGGAALVSGLFGGPLIGTIDFYPSLRDARKIDQPMLAAQGVVIDEVQVSLHPHDVRADGIEQELKVRSENGDFSAKRMLLAGYTSGWFMAENGEEYKLDADTEQIAKLAGELERAGIPGGAYALAEAEFMEWGRRESKELDGMSIRNRYLADASRYFWPAFARVGEAYSRNLPGIEQDSGLAKLWNERASALKLPERRGVPYLGDEGRQEYGAYLAASDPRYFAISRNGAYGMSVGDNASSEEAIKACEARNAGSAERCRLYARKSKLVWDACPVELAGPEATTLPAPMREGQVSPLSPPPSEQRAVKAMFFNEFLKAPLPRALAYADNGEVAMASGDCRAAYRALKLCRERVGQACRLYILDDQIVKGTADAQLAGEAQRLVELVERALQSPVKIVRQEMMKN